MMLSSAKTCMRAEHLGLHSHLEVFLHTSAKLLPPVVNGNQRHMLMCSCGYLGLESVNELKVMCMCVCACVSVCMWHPVSSTA